MLPISRSYLNNKHYADNAGPSYAYTAAGRFYSRTWVRGVVTTYGYDAAGQLTSTIYSDGTPSVSIGYDRAGRPTSITDASGVRALSYDASNQLQDEDYTAGMLAGLAVHRTFDSQNRLSDLSALSGGTAFNEAAYGYDSASRLQTVTSGALSANDAYVTNSALLQSVTVKNGTDTKLTTTKAYDYLNRLTSITNTPLAGDPLPSFTYGYNTANQRVKATREDGSYWNYGYDALGQVTSGGKFLSDGTPMLGHSFGWTYDDIGNRKTSVDNGQTSTYTPNSLNQYTQRTVPGAINVLGSAQADATVKVTPAGGTPQDVTRQGSLFAKGFTVDNSAGPIPQQLEIDGVKANVGPSGEDAVSSQIRHALVPKTPEQFTYDGDGNLTADARWTYTWDGENRLKGMTAKLETIRGERRPRQLDFAYNAQGRRIEKKVTRSSAIGVALRATYFSSAMLQGSSSSEEIGSLDATIGGPSAQWNGTLQVPTTGSWTLKLYESGGRGYRLWIDGVVRFSAWPTSTGATQQVTLNLTAGQDYTIRVDFTGTNGAIQLTWTGPGVAEEDIPPSWSSISQAPDVLVTSHYLSDSLNIIAELNGDTGNTPTKLYLWGSDLSENEQNAGGVGGLLFTKDLPATANSQHATIYDGNGNIQAYLNSSNGSIDSLSDFGVFGETLKNNSSTGGSQDFGFATKYKDSETGLLYYGFRYYNPSNGRWLSKDPINENGGWNLYGYVRNRPSESFDANGLQEIMPIPIEIIENTTIEEAPMPFEGPGIGADGPGLEPVPGPAAQARPTPIQPFPFPGTLSRPGINPSPIPNPVQLKQYKPGESAEYSGEFHLQRGVTRAGIAEHWRQNLPPTKMQGKELFERFWGKISFAQDELKDEHDRILKYIDNAPWYGYPESTFKSWPPNVGRCWHIDLEIVKGNAFVSASPPSRNVFIAAIEF